MASSTLDSLNQGHLVAGKITATAGTAAALTCNDGSAKLTRGNTGDYTVNFGQAFLSAPVVVVTAVDATFATDTSVHVVAQVVSASAAQFNIFTTTGTTVTVALADAADLHFMAFGKRNL